MAFTILLVEDNSALRESMALYLRKLKHDVYEAQTVEQALRYVEQFHFDVVIADYCLADSPGLDFLTYVHSVSPRTKKILVTGAASSEVWIESDAIGISCFFKPFSLDSLASELQKKSA